MVGKVGTVPVQRDELLGALAYEAALPMGEKVLPLGRLLARVAAWRSAGQRVVFTNGCFDLLHIGHIILLEQARHAGDRLIVGLNSDNSVRRIKGPPRPIIAQDERAHIVAALSSVDAVVVFDESTPLKLIEAIRPDVLVKGGDYAEDNIAGAREVRAWGGRVEIIPLVEGVSTTRLLAKATATASLPASEEAEASAVEMKSFPSAPEGGLDATLAGTVEESVREQCFALQWRQDPARNQPPMGAAQFSPARSRRRSAG